MSEESNLGYIGYQEMIADLTAALESTGEVMTQLELPQQAQQAKAAGDRIKSHVFSVGIMGEFKRGKSTVINALLGQKIAPADIVPASATLNRITYGLTPKATIVYKDGRREEVPVDKIADYVTKITEESAATAQLVEQAVVEYPCQFCQNNVEIIDTPGLNDDERMDAISEAVIPNLDAVVFVVSAAVPFSKSEAEFVRGKLMTSDVSRLIVLVNRIDAIFDEDDRARLLDNIRDKIVREILDRTASVHGADSKIYAETKAKLADIRLYPISAIQALKGRTDNKPALVEQSGIAAFEDRLRRLLTQERGILEISRVASTVTSLLAEGENALNMRMSALEMSTEEFLKNQKEAEAKIQELRAGKKQEKARIRARGREIHDQMESIVAEKYTDLETRLAAYLDQYAIPADAVKDDKSMGAFRVSMGKNLEKEISGALSDYAEQINVFLQESIGDERLRVQQYMGDLSCQLTDVGGKMHANSSIQTVCTIGVDGLTNVVAAAFTGVLSAGGFGLMGLGGALEGYRAAGAKGAATGLLGGFAGSTAVAFAVSAAFGPISFIPFALITGVAGTMSGKLLTHAIWGKDIKQKKIEEMRGDLKKTASQAVRSLKEDRALENWAQKQADTQIDALVRQMEEDAEAMIAGTEDTLKAIASEITKANQTKEQRMEECRKLEAKMKSIAQRITPILHRAEAAGCQSA